MPQTSLLNFFNKTPKTKTPLQTKNSGDDAAASSDTGKFVPGTLHPFTDLYIILVSWNDNKRS